MQQIDAFIAAQPEWTQSTIGVVALIIAAIIANFVLKSVILRAANPILDEKSDTINKAAAWLATAVPLLIISQGIEAVPNLRGDLSLIIHNVAEALIVLSFAMAIVKGLAYANELYERQPRAKDRPIKGFVQLLKIIVLCGAAIILISILINQSPFLLLSGLGAITAVLLLVFKDTLLSLVASIQLATTDMLRIGDWITMSSMEADGDVIDISLHTVKVQNFDKTITTIPTHRLVSDSFRNWRGMSASGGRRIKRSLMIDQNSIRFLQDEEVIGLKRFNILKDYLAAKRDEIAEWNANRLAKGDEPVNARRLTNFGTFRAYVGAYLAWHPGLNGDKFTMMVRQLPPSAQGVPLEIYCFTDTVNWGEFENIQADIFDHLIAIVPEFGLKVFQEPSGSDFANAAPMQDSEA